MNYHFRPARGFSLVELSIVLVILGLLVGGVLSGQSLIKASTLRAYTKQHEEYYTAVLSFRQKYFALPGDMPNATQFWGLAAAGDPCRTTASTDIKTCDGNGDGQIYFISSSNEYNRLWQQLANAGLIAGQYNGSSDLPISKLSGKPQVQYFYLGHVSGSARSFDGDYLNNYSTSDPMTPADLWNVDTKVDDGKPGTGRIAIYDAIGGFPAGGCSNGTSSTDYKADYIVSSSTLACWAFWRQDF